MRPSARCGLQAIRSFDARVAGLDGLTPVLRTIFAPSASKGNKN
ncbi:hypothetical protein HMPREF9440_02446 [Sutterella parvirubra YIT 11816]|uniref:Uncharacterized protein n=1 Tax=Sutterella parvirubra YIT 11816 TaxID=762967 RepID=H3KI44_9BURK|nr:hypothetical protein HMPREF9440_02446 [Sutterella parvirubra YIT 11816]